MTILSFGGGNILRLISNLILTRILMPEAFGLMALVQVFIIGLEMFSDTGINVSIIQSKRGEDRDFLNTAWSIQVVRGALLWLLCCLIAYPVGQLYGEPLLAALLPLAGLSLLVMGFTPTKVASANRNLQLGRLTAIELATQAVGIVIMVALTWWLQSVWALAIGNVITTLLRVVTQQVFLPGIRNRFFWEKDAFWELFNFGKFIFLSTAVGFAINQGDKAILGGYVSFAELGVYNIGYFLGAIPFLLNSAIANKVILPLYRMKPLTESAANRQAVFRMRRLIGAGGISLCVLLAFCGVWLINLLYRPEYTLAGPVIVLLSLSLLPQIIQSSYGVQLLALGASRNFFLINLLTAIVQTTLMFVGVIWFGILGVILATGTASLVTYPVRVWLVAAHKGWDIKGDALLFSTGFSLVGLACWLNWDEILKLIP